MKYIRTKDGRLFNKGKIICYAFREEYISPNWNDDIEKYLQTKIVAEADTIEELCDGLIVEEKGNPNNWFIMEVYDFKNEEEHLKGWTYRAFIKTDKGLIYVAKMNEKGELELL